MGENVKLRQQMERRIARRVILDGLKAGYTFNINNGGDEYELPGPTDNTKLLLDTMFATDDEHLIVFKEGKRFGWVYFIYGNGNGGLDVISDYSTNLDHLIDPICQWIEDCGVDKEK